MKVRMMEARDLPELEAIHAHRGYKYPMPDINSAAIEAAQVVVNDDDGQSWEQWRNGLQR